MLFCSTASADNYRWIDNKGVINFTDNPLNVPSEILTASSYELAGMNATTEATISALLRLLKYRQNADENLHRNMDRHYEYESRSDALMVKERMFNKELNSNLKELQNRVVELEGDIQYNKRHKPIFINNGHHGHNPPNRK